MDIKLLENKDITISAFVIGKTVISFDKSPKKAIMDWTPAYEKRCKHWAKVGKERLNKKLANA